MSTYYHGVRVLEEPTPLVTPIEGTAALQVIFGTAPINLAKNPRQVTNIPIRINSFKEFCEYFGYDTDFAKYTLCMSAYANFQAFAIAPIICVNVLDPDTHKTVNAEQTLTVVNKQAKLEIKGVLLDTVVVKNGDTALVAGTDYALTFDDEGYVVITILGATVIASIAIESTSINPTAVVANDIIGGYDANTGAEKGIETVRQVYPRYNLVPGLLLAPGWSHIATVGAVLQAKCEGLNGVFRCECILDLDTAIATKYSDCDALKASNGYVDKHAIVLWPKVKTVVGNIYFSAIYAAMVAYIDVANDDIPNLSPSNELLKVIGAVLESGADVVMDEPQANILNSQGIVTVINDLGWKAWGNNTACYPAITDPKDRWICCRRFFSWWGNSFILTYKANVDDPTNTKLIESVCDTENIRGNSYVSQSKCAGAAIEYRTSDNPLTNIVDGRITFRQHLAPYTPAEDIVDILSFDTTMLQNALGGN